jgi:dCMP deaminase
MIIGLTGKNGSGKGAVAEILRSRGFDVVSLSDILRQTLEEQGTAVTRENLIECGNRLREEHGAAVLADRIAEKLRCDRNYAVDSIRNPSEVARLRKLKGFVLAYVDAPVKTRFERCVKRGRENAEQTLAAFEELERRESRNADRTRQQLDETARLADFTIDNCGDLHALESSVLEILKECGRRLTRPDWDTYFMEIARVVARRSNCVKRQVAAVIVKDRRIISTGYNGTPRGIQNCHEGGCPRCNSFGESGRDLGECLCSHAEENSITQAAYHGVSIKGATIYTTFSPCLICTKMIINSGIREVVYDAEYSLSRVELGLLEEAGVRVRPLRHRPKRTAGPADS